MLDVFLRVVSPLLSGSSLLLFSLYLLYGPTLDVHDDDDDDDRNKH